MGQHAAAKPEPAALSADLARISEKLGEGPVSRRSLIGGGLAAATAAGAGAFVLTHGGPEAATSGTSSLTPSSAVRTLRTSSTTSSTSSSNAGFALPKHLDTDLLVSRVSYGRTTALEHDVHHLGTTKWLLQQLKPSSVHDPGGKRVVAQYPRLRWSAATVHAKLNNGDWAIMQDLVAAHIGRAIWSRRQLNEVMVDFWSNHLNVTCPSSDVWDTRHRYDADVIRKHALGRFDEMLVASGFHPSMLVYLNGAESTGAAPNENYGREVMELHTVGVNGGYSESDVHHAAMLMTGWVVENGKARFDPTRHHFGSVHVLGFHAANSTSAKAVAAQRAYLRYLARHPKTAERIAHKLAVRFVSDDPPASLVKRMARRYLSSKTSIVPVLKTMFSSHEFAESGGQKVRRPFEHVVATARAIGVKPGTTPQALMDLSYTLSPMGHVPLGWDPPNGYPDVAASWQSPAAALALFNSTTAMVHGWWPNKLGLPGAKGLLAHPPHSRGATIDAVAEKVYGRHASSREKKAAGALLAGTDLPSTFTAGSYQQTETAALVATLFLMSPGHTLR